jgi:hypothetical protein
MVNSVGTTASAVSQGNKGPSNTFPSTATQTLTKPADTTATTPTTTPSSSSPTNSSAAASFQPQSTLQERLIEYTFQLLGISAAIIFGVWSVKSYSTSLTANSLSNQALALAKQANDIAQTSFQQTIYQNQLALLAFCVGATDARFNETCSVVIELMAAATATSVEGPDVGNGGGGQLANIATAVGLVKGGNQASSAAVPPPEAGRPPLELPFGTIVGIIVIVVLIVGVVVMILLKRSHPTQSARNAQVGLQRLRDEGKEEGRLGQKA